jgi:hypothetical protein
MQTMPWWAWLIHTWVVCALVLAGTVWMSDIAETCRRKIIKLHQWLEDNLVPQDPPEDS